MNVYIAVMFLVLNGQQVFWKHPEFFHSQDKCEEALIVSMLRAEDQGIPQYSGVCLSLKISTLM